MAEYRHSPHATFDLKYHVILITKCCIRFCERELQRVRTIQSDSVPRAGRGSHPRVGSARSYPHAVVSNAAPGPDQLVQLNAYIENQKWDKDDQGSKMIALSELQPHSGF